MSSSMKPLVFFAFEIEARFNFDFFADDCSFDTLFRLFFTETGVDSSTTTLGLVGLALGVLPFGVLLFGVLLFGVLPFSVLPFGVFC